MPHFTDQQTDLWETLWDRFQTAATRSGGVPTCHPQPGSDRETQSDKIRMHVNHEAHREAVDRETEEKEERARRKR